VAIRLVIAHRSTLIREALQLVGAPQGLLVVGEAVKAAELVALCQVEQPAVVYAEATFEDGTEIESVLPEVLATGARVLAVSDDPSPERLTRILAQGASGYVRHDTSPDQAVDAIVAVAGGAAALGPAAAAVILEQWRRLRDPAAPADEARSGLTAREHDVLKAMADGLAAKAIALRLGVAVKTVEAHKVRIFDKLGVRTQAHAVAVAIGHGLITPASEPASNGRQ
jgi:DNA-binding NarL/FixJ family response regulator